MEITGTLTLLELAWTTTGAIFLVLILRWSREIYVARAYARDHNQLARATAGSLLLSVGTGASVYMATTVITGILAGLAEPSPATPAVHTYALQLLVLTGQVSIATMIYWVTRIYDDLVRLNRERLEQGLPDMGL